MKAGPGEEVTAEEEARRTVGFVAEVRRRHPDVVISVDTWRADVGEAVCEAGADVLNDAWAGSTRGSRRWRRRTGRGSSAPTRGARSRGPGRTGWSTRT